MFADDLRALLVPPIDKDINKMMEFIEKKGTQVSQNLLEYSCTLKQSINVSKIAI